MLGTKLRDPGTPEQPPIDSTVAYSTLGPKLVDAGEAERAQARAQAVALGVVPATGEATATVVTNPVSEPDLPAVPVSKLKSLLKAAPELLPSLVRAELSRAPAEQRRGAFEVFLDAAKRAGAEELVAVLTDVIADTPDPLKPVQEGEPFEPIADGAPSAVGGSSEESERGEEP